MNITWKDGVTTVATAGAIIVERAHFHDYTWTLVSSARWTVSIIAVLLAGGFVASYVSDRVKGEGWTFVAGLLGFVGVALTAVGLITGNADYAIALMLTTIAFWLSALIRHLTVRRPMGISHA